MSAATQELTPASRALHLFFRSLDYATHLAALNTLGRMVRPRDPAGPRLLRNYPYLKDGSRSHLLDVWLPPPSPGPKPVVFYIHGGGFTFGSKDTHQIAGRIFSQQGYLTFVVNYRLAPKYPYPASIEDCCRALCWAWDNLEHFGGDPSRLVVGGESAGGNLTAMMAIVNSYKRPEAFAREVWDRKIPIRAAMPFCGWHDPGTPERYRGHPVLGPVVPVLQTFTASYLGMKRPKATKEVPLVSPLPFLEHEPDRPLPPFFIPIGTRDPLLGDSRRLKKSLDQRGVEARLRQYRGAIHAHHLFPFTKDMRQIWRDVFEFLRRPDIAGQKQASLKAIPLRTAGSE
ncbi:MAG: alpha/beta hydrolase [Bdellovibrionota bacterium]